MRTYRVKSFAKINLALNVTGKLNLLHKIESIFCFINLHDTITIKQIRSTDHRISYFGKFSKNISSNNTISNLFKILDQEKLIRNKKFQIKINKNIHQQAGLGGGSMNAARILDFLIKRKYIKINQKKITDISRLIGSDVILGADLKNGILKSNNNIKKFSNCSKFYVLLVKPNFGCSTKKIFSFNKVSSKKQFSKSKKNISKNIIFNSKNDLENSAFKAHPKLKQLKNQLINWKKAEFVRMTGSGSTLVMYFNSNETAKNALKTFKRRLNNSWCILSKVI